MSGKIHSVWTLPIFLTLILISYHFPQAPSLYLLTPITLNREFHFSLDQESREDRTKGIPSSFNPYS